MLSTPRLYPAITAQFTHTRFRRAVKYRIEAFGVQLVRGRGSAVRRSLDELDDERNLHSMLIDLPTVATMAGVVLAGIAMLNRGGGSGPGAE